MPEAHHRVQVVQGHAQAGLSLEFDAQRVVVQSQPALGRGDVKRVEELHRSCQQGCAKSAKTEGCRAANIMLTFRER